MVSEAVISGFEVGLLGRIIVALLSGMLIGIEREKARAALARRKQKRIGIEEFVVKEFPGLRTFSLVAVYAAVIGIMWNRNLIDSTHVSTLLAVFGLVVTLFSAYRLLVARMAGITTIVVLLMDFVIGFLAGLGEVLLAASIAVLTTFILAIKLPAERMVGKIRYEELLWALELGVILVVIGPFFLEAEYEFYGVSLRSLYLFFALVLATSYIGYIMARLKGGEGLAYAALFGGLANSEATLMALLALVPAELRRALVFDITVLTNSAMILRNVVIAVAAAYFVSSKPLQLSDLAPILMAMVLSIMPALFSWTRSLRGGAPITTVRIENPLRFSTAAKSTALYLIITFVSYLVQHSGLASLAAVVIAGGFVSSSATILALFSLGGLAQIDVARLAVVATIAGVLNKTIYAYLVDSDPGTLKRVSIACVLQALLMMPGLVLEAL